MKKKIELTEFEIVSYLKRTTLPTILVEGNDDALVYRWLESKIEVDDVDILKCSGRSTLLSVFKRRNEFASAKVVFVADRDMWYFTGIPDEYIEDIVFTKGYSLENDLYVRDIFEGLLDEEEKASFNTLTKNLCKWFAFEVQKYRSTGEVNCDVHVNQICPKLEICDHFKNRIGYIAPTEEQVDEIFQYYWFALRGKSLFQALLRFLSSKSRVSKYSRTNLIELGAKSGRSRVDSLTEGIIRKFEGQQVGALNVAIAP